MRKSKNKYWLVDDDALDIAMVRAGVTSKHDLAEKAKLDYSIFTHIYSRPLTARSVAKTSMVLHVPASTLFRLGTKK